jgi:hypothetical protein
MDRQEELMQKGEGLMQLARARGLILAAISFLSSSGGVPCLAQAPSRAAAPGAARRAPTGAAC